MYNIENKLVQAQIQAYVAFTKEWNKEGEWLPAIGPAIQNT